jgi:iron complex transport system permease protein
MRAKARWLIVLALAVCVAVVAGVAVGPVWLRPDEVFRALGPGGPSTDDPLARTIVRELRLPRAALAACVGAGLAAAGAAYQGLFRNPLAEPFVIGTASGAALGAAIVISLGWEGPGPAWLSPVPFGAFAGALLAAAVTYLLAASSESDSVVGLLLTGVAVGTLLNAALWVLLTWNDQDLARIVAWLMGSLAGRGWPELGRVWPFLALGVGGVWLLSRPLDALAEGEEIASSLGLRVRLATGGIVALASLATAAAVSAGGIIGFVGLIAPHIARRLVGQTHAWLVPASALLGAALLVLADAAARTLTAPVELPVGVVTAALGGPFFLVLLRGNRAWHS